jgi:myosin heavy subunit
MEVTSFVDGPVPEGGVPVWIEATGKDDLDQVWLAGKVLAQSGPLVTARLDKTNAVQQLDLRKTAIELANPASSNKTPNDVTSLHYINESSILETLGLRSTIKNAPYTFIGPVLIAVNPLQRVEDVPGTMGTSKASELPHPYAIAETAFSQMSFASDSRRVNKQTFETVRVCVCFPCIYVVS